MRRGAEAIEVFGARTHNLKDVSCSIPIGALTVVTGPSGSGKSSLAFDTVYAEGQRRFVESMSTYARQFLERMQRPDVDRIEHILPAIAIEQRAPTRSARSTVGTATEIHDTLRLLFASAGRLACPGCGRRVRRETPESVREDLLSAWGEGARVLVLAPRALVERAAPRPPGKSARGAPPIREDADRQVAEWLRSGFFRALDPASGEVVELTPGAAPPAADGTVLLVVARARLRADDPELSSSLETAFAVGEGTLLARRVDAGTVETRRYLRGLACGACGTAFEEPTPALFSFNSPKGACPKCQGFGRLVGIDEMKVVPDPGKTLDERPIAPFNTPSYESAYADLKRAAKKHGIRRDVPWSELTARERRVVWEGEGSWYGVEGLFAHLEKKRYKMHVRIFLARYRGYPTCSACLGARLNPAALAVTVGGKTIAEVAELPLESLRAFLLALDLTPHERARAGHLLEDLARRVGTLVEIGLPYLTLSRHVRTLSGGEAQRVQLGSAIGNALTGTLYVLDEPTVGLHPRDTERLLGVVSRLARAGNAVLVVEHDLDVIRAADHVLDLGPGAGHHGGRLVFEGPPADLELAPTATGEALREDARAAEALASPALLAAENVLDYGGRRAVTIVGARAHNLKDLTVSIPLGRLVAVAGVSGSGKSSLVVDVLYAGGARSLGKGGKHGADEIGAHDRIDGLDAVDELVLVDQSPLGRSSRSNPATYTKAWDELRTLLSRTEGARRAGLTKGDFSFNAAGGRCEACEGSGVVTVDMQFLADVTVVCDTCDGHRFSERVLAVRLRGRNVSDLLATTVDEARDVFADVPPIVRRLAPLHQAGLGYLRLGQPTSTLSGGEAQRLKIASYLGGGARGRGLFVFDEPTTGLHAKDVGVLLRVLRRLVASGHTVVAVEHNLGFLASADHVIELGPEGGEAGGRVVFAGTPRALAARGETPTGAALLARSSAAGAAAGTERNATISG